MHMRQATASCSHPVARGPSALRHDYESFIRTAPEALWNALTSAEQTCRHFHGTRVEPEWRVGAPVIYHSSHDGHIAEVTLW